MPSDSPDAVEDYEVDPAFLNSRREAIAVFMTWVVAMFWAVPVCYTLGFKSDVDSTNISMVLGIPSWVFWGIVVPWLAADVVTTWLCFRFIKDDDLGIAADEVDAVQSNLAASQAVSK